MMEVLLPKECWTSKFHSVVVGATMLPMVVKPGGEKSPPVAVSSAARLSPALKPDTSAAFDPAAVAKTFPFVFSFCAMLPKKKPNVLSKGVFSIRLSATDPWNVSMKMPIPPRNTVFLAHDGDQAKPKRGCHETLVNDGAIFDKP